MNDYLWTAVQPRSGDSSEVDRMNAMLLAFAPNTPARHDSACRAVARGLLETEQPSVAEIFRRELGANPEG